MKLERKKKSKNQSKTKRMKQRDQTTKSERRKYKQTGSAFICDVIVLLDKYTSVMLQYVISHFHTNRQRF